MRTIVFLLLTASAILAGPKLDRADRMLEGNAPFSFDVLYGSHQAFEAVRALGKVEVYRLDSEKRDDAKRVRGRTFLKGPVELRGVPKEKVRQLLLSKDSFASRPACPPVPGILMSVTSGATRVDFDFCFECHMIIIRRDDEDDVVVAMTETSVGEFLRTFQQLFPEDEELKKIKLK